MTHQQSGQQEFSRWRAFLWPVHYHELNKLIPMLLIFFLISFDYNVLRMLKDTLVVTAKSSGAEAIPFIKVWAMFPGALLLTFIFTRLANRFSRETVFYAMISGFLLFFFVFAFFLYPMRESLHPHELADQLQTLLPLGFKGMIAMFRNWTFTAFYVVSELWSNIIVAMLFWGFANQITQIGEAKRFYGLFGIGANFSGIVAGQASVYLCCNAFNPSLPFGDDAWGQTLVLLVSLVLVSGVVAMGIFRWMHKKVLVEEDKNDPYATGQGERQESNRLSMRDSFAYLLRSKYLIGIALIVLSYNLVINLVEVVWKHQVKELYPSPGDYNSYMNQIMTLTGILATLTALFISGNAVRRYGWTFTAMLTPAVLFLTSVGFFAFFFLKPYIADMTMALLSTTPLALAVFFGSAQNILSRAAKYTVFDATKEMAFVPLGAECKLKGKAVIDGVCSRLGKSGGSVIHQTLLLTFATISASAPYVAGFLLSIIVVWMVATRVLGRQFVELTRTPPGKKVAEAEHPVAQAPAAVLDRSLQEQQAI